MAIAPPWSPVPEKQIEGICAYWKIVNGEDPCIEDQKFALG